MKSEKKETEKRFYPRLMRIENLDNKGKNIVVCFTREKCGVVVYPTDHNDFMKPYNDWKMEWFEEFTGEIILSN